MASRTLRPTGKYHGPVWGPLPQSYPTDQAERVYRYLIEQIPIGKGAHCLMGDGFKGVAYRFRAAVEYATEFESSFCSPGGVAPPADQHYQQERALFGFFTSGLACLESFAFALHAIANHYKPLDFGITKQDLKEVDPATVTHSFQSSFPHAMVTTRMKEIVDDLMFKDWNKIRNVLSHRAVPSRAITANIGAGIQSTWLFKSHQNLDQDEPLESVIGSRRNWLGKRVCELWDALEDSFPPP